MGKMLDCGHEVNGFEVQLGYNIYFRTNTFRKGMNPFIIQVMGLTKGQ